MAKILSFLPQLASRQTVPFFLSESDKGTGTIEPGLRCAGAGNSHDLWVAFNEPGRLVIARSHQAAPVYSARHNQC
jgi:hypothetical protein